MTEWCDPCFNGCPECVTVGVAAASEPVLGDVVEARGCRCLTNGDACDNACVAVKLRDHEEWAPTAVQYLIDWLRHDPEALLAMARGRHAEGHYRYGDGLMYEYDQNTLKAEAAQELADAINYIALLLRRNA